MLKKVATVIAILAGIVNTLTFIIKFILNGNVDSPPELDFILSKPTTLTATEVEVEIVSSLRPHLIVIYLNL